MQQGRSGGTSTLRQAEEEAPLIGRRVTLCGLKARPDLNGTRGVVLRFEEGRYVVRLHHDEDLPRGGITTLNAVNLQAIKQPGERATLRPVLRLHMEGELGSGQGLNGPTHAVSNDDAGGGSVDCIVTDTRNNAVRLLSGRDLRAADWSTGCDEVSAIPSCPIPPPPQVRGEAVFDGPYGIALCSNAIYVADCNHVSFPAMQHTPLPPASANAPDQRAAQPQAAHHMRPESG